MLSPGVVGLATMSLRWSLCTRLRLIVISALNLLVKSLDVINVLANEILRASLPIFRRISQIRPLILRDCVSLGRVCANSSFQFSFVQLLVR